ncbi:unnamed protein product, partial [Ectocarpus sp. 8 AP-2014]
NRNTIQLVESGKPAASILKNRVACTLHGFRGKKEKKEGTAYCKKPILVNTFYPNSTTQRHHSRNPSRPTNNESATKEEHKVSHLLAATGTECHARNSKRHHAQGDAVQCAEKHPLCLSTLYFRSVPFRIS